ncbi:Homocysteine S-methyltransferase [Xylaria arbuscula]|nr:Homocysteine S-methyltransferase [Xylaria arbuscula]
MDEVPIQFLDGGLGTTLEDNYKVRFTEATPLWSSHLLLSGRDRETLTACQRSFAQVPVDILLTATYQVSEEGFRRTRTDAYPGGVPRADIPQFLDVAVSIVEQVKHPTTKLALSIGSYGAIMTPSQEYTGRYDDNHNSIDTLYRWYADRMSLFTSVPRLDSRVDFIAFETVPRLDEILAIRRLTTPLSSQSADAAASGPLLGRLPYWISCVFPGNARALPDGSSISQAIRALLSLEHSQDPPWGIGINCTKIAELPNLVKEYERSVRLLEEEDQLRSWPTLILYPDGTDGEVYDTATKTWKMPTGLTETNHGRSWEKQLAHIVTEARKRGCWRSIVVGGCCKTGPGAISNLRAQVLHHSQA